MIFEKNDTLLFIGDSISDYDRKRPVGEGLFNGWGTSYVANVGALLGCMYPEMGIRVKNVGISGNQVRDLDARWQTDVLDQKPDWVSVLIGINDVWRQFDSPGITTCHVYPDEYRSNLCEMLERTLPMVKGVILMSPFYMEPQREDRMRQRIDEYIKICEEVAKKYNCHYINMQQPFDDYLVYRHSSYIAWDRVHPGNIGSLIIAREFLKAIGVERPLI